MRAWWGRLSLRVRLALAFGAMAASALIFLLAIMARTIGMEALHQGRIVQATVAVLLAFFLGGWYVAGWCLHEIARLGAEIRRKPPRPLPAELEGLAVLLRHEARRHDRLLAELRRFTADAAHELRTPLTALRTIGEVALRSPADETALRDAIGGMLEETQRMNGLIDRLLHLARMESEDWPVRWQTLSLRRELTEACDGLTVLAEERGARIVVDCEEGLEVAGDASLLQQALLSLLDNAIRHSPAGGTITVRARREEDHVRLEVSDEGPGIAPEHHERIFERFYRVDPSRDRSQGGSGLGLCIAKTAVERMEGRIEVESTPGHGATFRIRLPDRRHRSGPGRRT